jgi:GR25 family glycosyltransferase involved in LPS biosynthesis
MDRNKSLYKLDGLPKVYWINLDRDEQRRDYMNQQLSYWEVKDAQRIVGFDAKNEDVSSNLSGRFPDMLNEGELGCVLSHLKAIKTFYEETDDPYAIIMEDDVSFDTVKHWNFTWRDLIAKAPYGWDVLQMAIICTGNIIVPFHNRFINDFSAAFYVITRHHAEKIIRNHIRGEKYKLDNGVKPRPTSEDLVFGSGVTYSSPLFLYNLDLGSNIHPEHIDIFHRNSHDGIKNFWREQGYMLTIDQITTYDPYLGRVSGGTKSEA